MSPLTVSSFWSTPVTERILPTLDAPPTVPQAVRPRSGLVLAIIVTCQMMLILDVTVMNVALPAIQADLHFSATGLSWVISAYTLTFGGLLMLGGRAGDILGRRRPSFSFRNFSTFPFGCSRSRDPGA